MHIRKEEVAAAHQATAKGDVLRSEQRDEVCQSEAKVVACTADNLSGAYVALPGELADLGRCERSAFRSGPQKPAANCGAARKAPPAAAKAAVHRGPDGSMA